MNNELLLLADRKEVGIDNHTTSDFIEITRKFVHKAFFEDYLIDTTDWRIKNESIYITEGS